MNDPNGMFQWRDGALHVFAQHNPRAPVWGQMHWWGGWAGGVGVGGGAAPTPQHQQVLGQLSPTTLGEEKAFDEVQP